MDSFKYIAVFDLLVFYLGFLPINLCVYMCGSPRLIKRVEEHSLFLGHLYICLTIKEGY